MWPHVFARRQHYADIVAITRGLVEHCYDSEIIYFLRSLAI